jgi:hypothetical protein
MRRVTHLPPAVRRLVVLLLLALTPSAAAAQRSERVPAGVFVGSDRERYLRVLQTLGLVPLYPWSIRGLSPTELDRLQPLPDVHPWSAYPGFAPVARAGGPRPEVLPATISTRYNTAFPFGINDGATWAGRGLTTSAQAGAVARQGPLTVVIAPMVFWTQNRAFALMPNGQSGPLRFADPAFPTAVDRPQRFGDGAYAAFDPGQSGIRLDLWRAIAFGLSTANQWWGPMTEFPYLLGNNAPGFTHVFVGSPLPWNVLVGHLHARVIYGELGQSAFTDITGSERRRLASGVIVAFSPRGARGLELGAARFYHMVWPSGGLKDRHLGRPFETFYKANLRINDTTIGPENQLAAVFGRWVLPGSGFEVYAEYGREDHNADTRDLIQEPDHDATYGIGLQKAWMLRDGAVVALRGELTNAGISTLARHRTQIGPYIHSMVRQGHTHRGQLLGSGFAAGYGGSGTSVTLERYSAHGSESIKWARLVRQDRGSAAGSTVRCSAPCLDVQHVLRADRMRMYGRFEVRYGLGIVYEMNRDFLRDAVNWSPEVELRWNP